MSLSSRDGQPRTLTDVAVAELRNAIVSGEIKGGTPLRLREIVDRLSMSTVPIREALRFLEQQGLIERTPHKGVLVREMSLADLKDTYRVRLELESLAVRQASVHLTEADHKHLLVLLDEYAVLTLAQNPDSVDAHTRLHMGIYNLAQSNWLDKILPPLWDNSERYRRLQILERGIPEERVAEHRELVQACASGDPEKAETALREHLSRTVDFAEPLLADGG